MERPKKEARPTFSNKSCSRHLSEVRKLKTRYQKVLDDLREKEKKDEQMEKDVADLVKRFQSEWSHVKDVRTKILVNHERPPFCTFDVTKILPQSAVRLQAKCFTVHN